MQSYRQAQEQDEYQQWLDDPVAQEEYRNWLDGQVKGDHAAQAMRVSKEIENELDSK